MSRSQEPARPNPTGPGAPCLIRPALEPECPALGELMATVYEGLEGFPKPGEQPKYYEMLRNIHRVAQKPGAQLLVAVAGTELLGGVVYFADMAEYGSGGSATQERNAAGFRLLAVTQEARGRGVGRALVDRCLELAREQARAQVIIHSTRAMEVAWKMYEKIGFKRSLDLDFMQGELPVFGFRLVL